MDRQYGMTDFFAMEAGEYLERLDGLLSAPVLPTGEELQRLARALRGAALMANQQPIAAAAGAFEHLARAIRDGRHVLDEGTRQLAIRAVDDLKVFVRHAREWSDADTARARELAATLERAGGRAVTPPRLSGAVAPDAGTRAFVAREGAALASSLTGVAESIKRNPVVTEPVQALLRQMQPLRGLATLTEYPPLPDLLDGIERAAALVARSAGSLEAPGELLGAAARALTKATRDITTGGKADPDASEVHGFAQALRAALGFDRPEVRIEDLYAANGPPIAEQGARPREPRLGQVELTALGEHLKQVGIGIASAGFTAQRQLRMLALVGPLRSLEDGVADELQLQVRAFARACRDAIARDVVTRSWEPLGHAVQEAGVAVAAGLGDALERLTSQVAQLAGKPARPPAAPAPQPAPAARATPAPAATGAAAQSEPPDLAGSLMRYRRLVATEGLGSPSLDEFLAGAAAERVATPPPTPTPAPTPHPTPVARVDEDLVSITALCYSGKTALDRALSLREQVTELVAAGASVDSVQELLEEVFDLVRLGASNVA